MTFVRRYAAPLLALIVGLTGTAIAAMLTAQAEAGRRQARFDALADSAVAAIESRMLGQLTLLRGTAGFLQASEDVNAEDFHDYISRLRLEENYPGVLGIGYSIYASDAEALARKTATASTRTLRLWPNGARPDYSAVVYLEPLNRQNQAALGFDMLSEATRREAMIAAAKAGHSRATGKVRLVQEINPVKQPGFLIYTPLFRGSHHDQAGTPKTPLFGWVYSPLRAYDLFGAIFAERDLGNLVVEVFDRSVDDDHLLYRSQAQPLAPDHRVVRHMEVAGRPWRVRLSSTEHFDAGSPLFLALLVGGAGTLISLLIAAVMLQQVRARAEIEREVRVRTAELEDANARLRAEGEAREMAEAQVRQMQKMEAVGQLTGGIAHDFNNMLAVIVGNLDMAVRRAGDPERVARAIDNARQGADRAAELTRRLLAFGRRQSLSPQVIDVNALIAGMSEILRRSLSEAIRFEPRLGESLWRVRVDRAQLENAVLNLAINARDAMPNGGTLAIETSNRHSDEAAGDTAGDVTGGDFVRIAVIDTGCGMPADVVARAAEPFFTTKEVGRGTGLGLSQVYGFVRQSGGHLSIDSLPGVGTTIGIFLPRYLGDEEIADVDPIAKNDHLPRARPGETILLAEDEPRVREMGAETLRELGYRVLDASNGIEALALLDSEPNITLLFTDIVMPEMDGRRLAEAARAQRPGLNLLFTTGYAPEGLVPGNGIDAGRALLQKPYSAQQLARRVRHAIDSTP
ncbi:CHASE domain-containing protein [Sphingosinicella sp. BN140058]|uniref:CHASE domain-containing protein n=1 Tax=Sphingosinicella sp. BN140058 TaxID=1892855 RepID=UPI00101281F4|nr:CHASE domain-containing protein [Sphingosinicella sp. BN140058]QAY78612.1 response regulator [Sphingosinicella sp. BN140058]